MMYIITYGFVYTIICIISSMFVFIVYIEDVIEDTWIGKRLDKLHDHFEGARYNWQSILRGTKIFLITPFLLLGIIIRIPMAIIKWLKEEI